MDPNFNGELKAALLERVNGSQLLSINFDIEDHSNFGKIAVVAIIHTFTYSRCVQEYSYESINQMGSNAVDLIVSTFMDKLSVSLHQEIDRIFGTSLD